MAPIQLHEDPSITFKPPAINLQCQAVALPNTQQPGATAIYRNALSPSTLIECNPITQAKTVYEVFRFSYLKYPDLPCLGQRNLLDPEKSIWTPYQWLTYKETNAYFTDVGAGILHLHGLLSPSFTTKPTSAVTTATTTGPGRPIPRTTFHVGIYSVNKLEWLITEQACNAYGLVSVALYDTLGASTLEFIINHAELPMVVASKDKLMNLIQLAHVCPNLKYIVSMDSFQPLDPAYVYLKNWAKEKKLTLLTLEEVRQLGKSHPRPHRPPSPSDLATICYTSGTTGNPKGAMLTHRNLTGQTVFPYLGYTLTPNDRYLSYLPLAHILERSGILQALSGGARIGFYRGDVNLLMEDAQALKPTLFVSVPRLFNKVYAKVKASTLDAPGIRGVLFRKAYQDKLLRLQQGQGCKHALWDRLLFQKVRAVLGGEIDLMVTGSAPLGNEVLQFLRVFFACEVLEGYGQTENAAGATLQVPGTYTTGHVGVPFVSCELKLVDVPDMNYHAAQGKGEIWLRGPIVFPGYWKDPVKTEEALDKDGWLRTGDIGALGPAGVLSIIDRKKNIFKLSQGEYIAPEKLENIYLLCPLLAQIFVHGDSLQSHLVAIVVPNEETFLPWAKKWVGGGIDKSKLSKNKAIHQALLKELDALARSKKLKGFEMIKALFIEWTPFSIENELLTPSFKLKRSQAVNHYRKEIDEMYQYIQKEINGKEDNPFFPKKANL